MMKKRIIVFCLLTFLGIGAQAMNKYNQDVFSGTTAEKGEKLHILGNIQLPTTLYKILSLEDWEKSTAGDRIHTPPSDNPFIHFSTQEQVCDVLKKKFSDGSYVVVRVNPQQLVGTLALEWDKKGIDQYYHLYEGYIPLQAIALDSMYSQEKNMRFGQFGSL